MSQQQSSTALYVSNASTGGKETNLAASSEYSYYLWPQEMLFPSWLIMQEA